MPRHRLPPRLVLREKGGRAPTYYIRDGRHEESTQFGPGSEREADAALGAYLIAKGSAPPQRPQSPEAVTVDSVLTWYGNEHAPTTADPARIGYCIKKLAPFFGDLPVSAVKGNVCRRYLKARGVSEATVRRELGCLRAALVHAEREGYLIGAPVVWLPEKPGSRDRWLTREEAAKLLWAARRTPHLARFILIALYTGTRRTAILRLRWMPHTNGGHVDLEKGLMFRRSAEARQTKKRQTPVRIPRKLLGHMRRWQRVQNLHGFVIEWDGKPVASIKTSWRAAIRRSGIADAHPHDLRHTCATWMMQQGVRRSEAASFLGTTEDVLESVYQHHHPDFQSEAARAMDR